MRFQHMKTLQKVLIFHNVKDQTRNYQYKRMILLLLLKMIMINLSDLIESKYKIIYQIMYKMKDKKRKKRMKA